MDIIPWEPLIRLWTWTIEQGGFICFEEKLRALEEEMEELTILKEDVTRQVQMALEENMEPLQQVFMWISRVENVGGQIDQLKNSASGEVQNRCMGVCPKNCWKRYKVGKKIEGKLREVADLKNKGTFNTIAVPAASTSDRLLRCLGREEPGIIGLYGAGGIGKTAHLLHVSQALLNSPHNFDFIIWAVVSQDVNLEKIQADIAREIGFLEDRWKDRSQEEKANEVSNILRQKKFVLLLDDLWEWVDLTKVGIPLPSRGNGSKLIFTTRTEEVCNLMGAEERIPVGRLGWQESWRLFQDKAGVNTHSIDPAIRKLAEAIARMCKGLPLALITIGRAMADKKTLQEWKHSIEVLNKCISEFSGTDKEVLALLKFSYDNLPSEKVRSCLLYCSLFPEDFSMDRADLIDYWIGEGFMGEYNDASGAEGEGHQIIDTLLNACLLEDEEKNVKMHDLIREMALWIACECNKSKDKYLVEAGVQSSEPPELQRWQGVRRMSLIAHRIQNLTEAPTCQYLRTLFLANNNLNMISDSFFQYMPSLTVLDLSGNRDLTEFPTGISKLLSLQYLNISRTGIKQLPVELKNLVKLRCFILENTNQLHVIPLKVISIFSHLNVLRMIHCASSGRVIGDGIQASGSLAKDLQNLEHLREFTISIKSNHSLQVFVNFNQFQTSTRALCLHHFKHSKSIDISFLEGMQCLDDLEFTGCTNLEKLTIDDSLIMRGRCFNSLHKVGIVNCSKLQNLTWLTLAPNLEFLTVTRCDNMEQIISQENFEDRNLHAFEKLTVLQLVSMPMLKSISPCALPFPCLKEIIVDECPNLKKLPLNANITREHKIVIQGREDWWKKLDWEDEATQRAFSSSFKASLY